MQQLQPINANKPLPQKSNLYLEFVLWSAMPTPERIKLGIETQKAFAEFNHVEESTLSRWKARADYQDRVRKILKMWAFDKTPDVVMGIYRAALKGNSDSQRIWLQYFEGWSEKQTVEHVIKVQMAPGDLRFLIEGMPEQFKNKFYGYIREIIDTAVSLRNAGQLLDGYAEDPAIEADVLEPANNDAQDLPGRRTDAVARGDQGSVCSDLEHYTDRTAPAPAHNNKSAARWW